MKISWITLYPDWYVSERESIARHYPELQPIQEYLAEGELIFYGELRVRPRGGTVKYPIYLIYPNATPFEMPRVLPLESLPKVDDRGAITKKPSPKLFDHRHQMSGGELCLFQRETRGPQGGECVRGIDVLKRARRWFLGYHTGHWPPDSRESELEAHFEHVGDVLLGEAFYSEEVVGNGRFFMVRDLRRIIDAVNDDFCPMIMTCVTVEGEGLAKVLDSRSDVSRVYPWITNDAWDPMALTAEKKDPSRVELECGYWWSLSKEPRPFGDGAGLLRELAATTGDADAWACISGVLGGALYRDEVLYFGLKYRSREGGVEWLMLAMPRGNRDNAPLMRPEWQKRREFEACRVGCLHVHSVRPEVLQLRNTGVVCKGLICKTVSLIGLGALGCRVAELLAQAGVGEFTLCDSDRLATGNVARHLGGVHQFGAMKTRVVESRLLEINPYLRIGRIDGSAVRDLARTEGILKAADLTISTTADENVESAINQVAVLNRRPVLYGRAMRRGSVGRVFLVRAGRDACKGCLGLYARDATQGRTPTNQWVKIEESDEDVLLHECGRPVIPASAADLSFISSLIARLAIDILEGRDVRDNHWIWSTRAADRLANRKTGDFSTQALTYERRPDCPVCREPDVTRVVIAEDVRRFIVQQVEANPGRETGGVLIGFLDAEACAVVVQATDAGPGAESSPRLFAKDVEYIQRLLDQSREELGERGMYVGEWHSHLENEPEPSALDIHSMVGIARAPHYLTRCPVMLIVGTEKHSGRVSCFRTWSFPIGARVYCMENEIVAQEQVEKWPGKLDQLPGQA